MHDNMFDFIFGWRKASKCKKLMKKVKCRLNLLKNKRCCIVRQLRNDVAQLVKHGHYQTAFDRVDQIYKDECIIAVYDLLSRFCEYLSRQLSYIRRTKDCPNDINEAISSLIFASARCGELPELLRIRKLFSERYGKHFEARALDLLPGNLVNFQIKENLSINKVPNEVKYKLVEEITTVVQTGPLALEYTSEQATKGNDLDQQDRLIAYHADAESSSQDSTKHLLYQEDIEEFQAGENGKDQSVFLFTSSALFPGRGNPTTLNLLISLTAKLGDSRRRSRVCSRAMSTPCRRWEEHGDKAGVMRSYSFPVQTSLSHVHPKLPDYDELEAKFMALKKEKFQNIEMQGHLV